MSVPRRQTYIQCVFVYVRLEFLKEDERTKIPNNEFKPAPHPTSHALVNLITGVDRLAFTLPFT